jgi:hypothetical protein
MKTKPLNNNVLIEVLRDDDGVSRTDENESMKYGRLVDVSVANHHLTASAAIEFTSVDKQVYINHFGNLVGKIVRWEEFAEGGQTFEEDGKTYALIPWWRLIGFEESHE